MWWWLKRQTEKNRLKLFTLLENPNDHEINYFLAKAYLDFGDSERALKYLEKTARLRYFDHGRVNYYLGILYFAEKKYNQALQHFPQVLKLRPNDNKLLADAHHYIALCYKEKGLVDEAIGNFEKSQIYSELLPDLIVYSALPEEIGAGSFYMLFHMFLAFVQEQQLCQIFSVTLLCSSPVSFVCIHRQPS